jgi:hypothetical protein
VCETADTKNKELACLLPWIILLSTSRRFFLIVGAAPSCLSSVAHLERDVAATSAVHNTVIKNEDIYHSSLPFSLSYYKTSSFIRSCSSSSPSSTYREAAHSGNDIGNYSV